jgi:hypothetical protein
MFFSTLRRVCRENKDLKQALLSTQDKLKAKEEEIERLQTKLEKRSDFFIEREFRLVDRFLTSKAKTFAITDEIRQKERVEQDDRETEEAALKAFLDDKKEFLVHCAHEAGLQDPATAAAKTFEQNQSQYILEFQQGA